jgi:hypothetical protein
LTQDEVSGQCSREAAVALSLYQLLQEHEAVAGGDQPRGASGSPWALLARREGVRL